MRQLIAGLFSTSTKTQNANIDIGSSNVLSTDTIINVNLLTARIDLGSENIATAIDAGSSNVVTAESLAPSQTLRK